MNPSDPLSKPRNGAGAQALFENLSKVAIGFTTGDVAVAGMNLLVNSIRQSYSSRDQASEAFDMFATKAKEVLLAEHYDLMGRRRNIFPFNQIISPEFVKFESKINGNGTTT